jgi:hypothetical protein
MIDTSPFISTQDLVDYIGRGGTADPGMVMAVDAACDMIRGLTEQNFNQATATIYMDGTGTDALVLPQSPIIAAGTVVANGGTITDYTLTGNGVLLRGTAGAWPRPLWTAGRQNVQITYDYGYQILPVNNVPRDVRMVALAIAARLVLQGPAVTEAIGDASVTYALPSTDFTPGERAILYGYIRHQGF